jgi:hypothetical protein
MENHIRIKEASLLDMNLLVFTRTTSVNDLPSEVIRVFKANILMPPPIYVSS